MTAAAAKGQGRAVCIEPVDELLAEQFCPMAVERRPLRVGVPCQFGIQQAIILDGPRDVVILLDLVAIRGPAVAAVIAVDLAKAVLQKLRAVGHVHAFQRQADQNAEEVPVAVRHGVLVDLAEPRRQMLLFGLRQRLPHLLRGRQDAPGNGRHFYKALVMVFANAPVFRAFRVGTSGKAPAVDGFKRRVGAAACPEGHQRPQRTAEGFQLDGALLVFGTGLAQMQPGTALGVIGFERV